MKLYVPNPQVWVDFFDHSGTGRDKMNQSGAGRRPRVIMVNQSNSRDDKTVPVKAVLPAEQTTAQAKSELERQDINPKKVEEMFQKAAGRRRRGVKRKRKSISTRKAKRQRGGKKRHRPHKKQRKRSRISKKKGHLNSRGDIFEIK